MSLESEISSVEQDEWKAAAAATREQFTKLIPAMGAMTPDELDKFVQAMKGALFLEVYAGTFDEQSKQEQRKALYGE